MVLPEFVSLLLIFNGIFAHFLRNIRKSSKYLPNTSKIPSQKPPKYFPKYIQNHPKMPLKKAINSKESQAKILSWKKSMPRMERQKWSSRWTKKRRPGTRAQRAGLGPGSQAQKGPRARRFLVHLLDHFWRSIQGIDFSSWGFLLKIPSSLLLFSRASLGGSEYILESIWGVFRKVFGCIWVVFGSVLGKSFDFA